MIPSNSYVTYLYQYELNDHKYYLISDMIEMFQYHTILPLNADPNQQYGHMLLNKINQIQNGKNLLFMVYGQFKSGKTYTLFGLNDTPDQRGLIPRAVQHILNSFVLSLLSSYIILKVCTFSNHTVAETLTDDNREFGVSMRILRIFNDKLYDVMNDDTDIRIVDRKNMNGHITWAKNAKIAPIKSIQDFNTLICDATQNSPFPAFNHIVFTLYLEYQLKSKQDDNTKNKPLNLKRKKHIYSQIHFVEIASADKLTHFIQRKSHPLYPLSPNNKKVNVHHQTNKFLHQTLESLVTIFTFIRQNAKFLPLRNTKLTHILKDCLSDPTANIIMLLTINPSLKCLDETLKTLHFGEQIYIQCMKTKLKSKPKIIKESNMKLTSTNELPTDYHTVDIIDNTRDDHIELLQEMKELISNPLKIKPIDIENVHLRISDMINDLKQNGNERMHVENKINRLEKENKMLRQHIQKQDKVISDFKVAIKKEFRKKSQRTNTPPHSHWLQSPKMNMDAKIDDIEQRLKEHTTMLRSLQRECKNDINDVGLDENDIDHDESDILPMDEIFKGIEKRHSDELEKVLATRHLFEIP